MLLGLVELTRGYEKLSKAKTGIRKVRHFSDQDMRELAERLKAKK